MLIEMTNTTKTAWTYPGSGDDRDLRVDFLRGVVMLFMITVHIEFFSAYNLLTWERVGVVSGAEGFVILSGLVLGMVYRKKIAEKGWKDTVWKVVDRAVLLWKVNVAVIVAIFLLSKIQYLDVSSIMTFVDRSAGQVYPLFPKVGTPFHVGLAQALLLKIGPHQLQVLGLYVCLVALSPLSLYLMASKRTSLLLGVSWGAYFFNWGFPGMPTGAQFEYGFPLLTWQLLFFHGQAAGFHRERLLEFVASRRGKLAVGGAISLFLGFLFWAQNTPNNVIPAFARLNLISPEVYNRIYGQYMLKNSLGLLRVLDDVCVLVAALTLLTALWKPINRLLGWFFIPMGQSSLYVFIVHVFIVALVANFLPFQFSVDHPNFWINTMGHTLALGLLWTMVRYKVLFRWIPR